MPLQIPLIMALIFSFFLLSKKKEQHFIRPTIPYSAECMPVVKMLPAPNRWW